MSLQPTGTHHPLPFERLSPADFERLCLWLVEREGFQNTTFFGARGKDGGRDIEGWKGSERTVFQCKRVQDFQPAQARREIEKLEGNRPDVVHFLLSCNPKAATIDAAQAAWGDPATCRFWGRDQLDDRVRRRPDIVENFFKPDSPPEIPKTGWMRAAMALGTVATLLAIVGGVLDLPGKWDQWRKHVGPPAVEEGPGQLRSELKGQILDDATGEPLAEVMVKVPEHGVSQTTGADGRFIFTLPVAAETRLRVRVSKPGFQSKNEDPMLGIGQFQVYRLRKVSE